MEVSWEKVRVGHIVKVHDREAIPADLIVLDSSESGGMCYMETSNIDGETNLKLRQCPEEVYNVRISNQKHLPRGKVSSKHMCIINITTPPIFCGERTILL